MTFEDWLETRLPPLLRLAAAMCGSPQVAEDVIQDVLVKAHARWARTETLENPDAYVRRMVINEHLSWRRRLARSLRQAATSGPLLAQSETSFDQRWADREELIAEIAKLPPRQRTVIALRYFEELNVAETARMLGCAEGTVRAHTARALARLRVGMGAAPSPPASASEHPRTPVQGHHAN